MVGMGSSPLIIRFCFDLQSSKFKRLTEGFQQKDKIVWLYRVDFIAFHPRFTQVFAPRVGEM